MLVLSRRVGEMISLPSNCAYVQVLSVKDGTVRLSIEAPRKVLGERSCENRKTRSDASMLALLCCLATELDGRRLWSLESRSRGLSLSNLSRRRKK
jgi:carbon storage regulator CsrA